MRGDTALTAKSSKNSDAKENEDMIEEKTFFSII